MLKLNRFLWTLLLVIPVTSFALPGAEVVYDPTEIAKTMQMIEQLKEQSSYLQQQVQALKTAHNDESGVYGWGSMYNTSKDLADHEWGASSWQQSLAGMSGGNTERYHQLQSQYQQNHESMSKQTYSKSTNAGLAKSYDNSVKTNQATATMSSYEFNKINDHLETLHKLGLEIEDAAKNRDTKSAVDLNSRIEIEMAFIQMENLRMQTVLNQQIAQTQAASITDKTEAAKFINGGQE